MCDIARSGAADQPSQAPHRPRPARAALSSSRRKRGAKRSLGGIVSERASPRRTRHGIHESRPEAHVGEQPAIDITSLDPEGQPHLSSLDQLVVERRGERAKALHRRVRLHRFRSVDADIADVLDLTADSRLDRVAVNRAHHEGADACRVSAVPSRSPKSGRATTSVAKTSRTTLPARCLAPLPLIPPHGERGAAFAPV